MSEHVKEQKPGRSVSSDDAVAEQSKDAVDAHKAAYNLRKLGLTNATRTLETREQRRAEASTPDGDDYELPMPTVSQRFQTIILTGFPVHRDPLPGAGKWRGFFGRTQTEVEWNELTIPSSKSIPGQAEISSYSGDGVGAWMVETNGPLDETAPAGMSVLRLILPGMTTADKKVRRIGKILGTNFEAHDLQSLGKAKSKAVLVSAIASEADVELLLANLRFRLPKAIFRKSVGSSSTQNPSHRSIDQFDD